MPATAKALAIREQKTAAFMRISQLQADVLKQSNRPPPAVINGSAQLAVSWRERAIEARRKRFVICTPSMRLSIPKMQQREQELQQLLEALANPTVGA